MLLPTDTNTPATTQSTRVFAYPPDLPRTLRRATRLRRLTLWPLFAAPFLAFTIFTADALALLILLVVAVLITLFEYQLSRRTSEAIRLAHTTLHLRGRALLLLSPTGEPLAQLDLDAPFKVRSSNYAAGNFTITASNPTQPPITFTNHLPAARELLQDVLKHPYPSGDVD